MVYIVSYTFMLWGVYQCILIILTVQACFKNMVLLIKFFKELKRSKVEYISYH
jgi:hypothetical protein